jgi:hypothetical protein
VADGRVRLEIAFEGGQALTVSVPVAIADDLDRALSDGEVESLAFEADDGRYTIAIRKIVFAKRYLRDGPVGFGSTGYLG